MFAISRDFQAGHGVTPTAGAGACGVALRIERRPLCDVPLSHWVLHVHIPVIRASGFYSGR